MARLVKDIVNRTQLDSWTPPVMADGSFISKWVGPWQRRVNDLPVDKNRTEKLAEYDVAVTTKSAGTVWEGSTQGQPYNVVSGSSSRITVWDMSRPITWNWFSPTFPTESLPVPDVVLREGDPLGAWDQHVIIVQPGVRLWELIQFDSKSVSIQSLLIGSPWQCGYDGAGRGIYSYDLSKPFKSGGRGTCAAGVPQFPLITRWDEVESGQIDHAMFVALPNYAPGKTGFAEGSDGLWKDHPCRAGEILRLKKDVLDRFSIGSPERVLANGMADHGLVVADKSTTGDPRDGVAGVKLSMDVRWQELSDLGLQLTDFEVVNQ